MDCLTRNEADERLRFAPEDGKFCPDCLTLLQESRFDTENETAVLYCPNEMCLNLTQYDLEGNALED